MNLQHKVLFVLTSAVFAALGPQLARASTVSKVNFIAEAPTLLVVRSATLKRSLNVPWSKPVRVEDRFEGTYLAVFDKHTWSNGLNIGEPDYQVITAWTRQSIQVLFTQRHSECVPVYDPVTKKTTSSCEEHYTSSNVVKLLIKVSNQVFQLEGKNNTFSVSNELSRVLQNAPDEIVDIRLVVEGGEAVDSKIGKGTVRAWKTVYQSNLGFNSLDPASPNPVSPIPWPTSTSSKPTESSVSPKELIDEVWQIVDRQYIDATFNHRN